MIFRESQEMQVVPATSAPMDHQAAQVKTFTLLYCCKLKHKIPAGNDGEAGTSGKNG
jgi:hypothetical protein